VSIIIPPGGGLLAVQENFAAENVHFDILFPEGTYDLPTFLATVQSVLRSNSLGGFTYTVRLDTMGWATADNGNLPDPVITTDPPTNKVRIEAVEVFNGTQEAFAIWRTPWWDSDPDHDALRGALLDALGFAGPGFSTALFEQYGPAYGPPFGGNPAFPTDLLNLGRYLGSELPTDGVPYVPPDPVVVAGNNWPWNPGPGRSTTDGGFGGQFWNPAGTQRGRR
jgi:hypothetical protein